MVRILAVVTALGLAVAVFVNPAPADAKPKPRPAYLDGIDVSYHQGAIDWGRVAGAGKKFAFVRATAGTLTADVAYETNLAGAHAAGLPVGSYHFGNPDATANDALNEARWFVQNAVSSRATSCRSSTSK